MPKVKRPAAWYRPPRGTARWLLAVLDYVQEEQAKNLERRARTFSPEQLAWNEDRYGEHDRLFLFLCTVTTNIEDEAQRARMRLWLSEGWAPPEAPPKR